MMEKIKRHNLGRAAVLAVAGLIAASVSAQVLLPLAGGLSMLGIGAPPPPPPKPAEFIQPMKPVVWRDFLGVNTQFNWFTPEMGQKQVDALKALGLMHVRQTIHWMIVEPRPGEFDLAAVDRMMAMSQANGLRSIANFLGSPRFASSAPPGAPFSDKYPPADPRVYAGRLAQLQERYPHVETWQVWNEPNILGFWAPAPDPRQYVKLLEPSVAALRARDPAATVGLAGMAYYSETDFRNELMFDALEPLGAYRLNVAAAYHPYSAEPEGGESQVRDYLSRSQAVNRKLRQRGVQALWASEWGWSSYSGARVEQPIIGERGQASYTLRRLALMSTQDFDRIYLFTLSDLDARASARDRKYGLLRENGDPKPVYQALSRFLSLTGPRLTPGIQPQIQGKAPDGLIAIPWRRDDGRQVWMVWSNQASVVSLKGIPAATSHVPLTGEARSLVAKDGTLRVDVGPELRMLVW